MIDDEDYLPHRAEQYEREKGFLLRHCPETAISNNLDVVLHEDSRISESGSIRIHSAKIPHNFLAICSR